MAIVLPEHHEAVFPLWLAEFEKVYESNVKEVPGANELVRKLHFCGVKCFVLSTKFDRLIHVALKKYKIDDCFVEVLGREREFAPKPSKEGIEYACKKYGFKKSEVVLVGDSITDQDTAKNAKIKFIYFEGRIEKYKPTEYWKKAQNHLETEKFILE